ncbi:uncharacterized protein LOC126557931 [Anopheles maculipalpis]|uniref:uncharacterized protein LOC126557931 n=1 Tax=Anopheles maculipalpis TaxID=1496333 RepID=UPI0021595A19|nr:uncharacterized protein LOC126557931 [Anopheles maculipalpis]
MPQRRAWKQPKQDHSVYVQQLFKDFLTRNNEVPIAGATNNARTNCFRPEPCISKPRKQPGIFDRAVYARFERNTNSGCFMRQEPTNRSKTGLMRWIDQTRNKGAPRNLAQKASSRMDDYLNLPGNFFSGTEQMELPFEVADKTFGNVTNNFIPPATSTPFDRMASFGVSGVLSDPEELQTNHSEVRPTSASSTKSSEWEMFLKSCGEYLADVTKKHDCGSELTYQRKEMEKLLNTDDINLPEKSMETMPAIVSKRSNVVDEQQINTGNESQLDESSCPTNRQACELISLATPMNHADPFPTILDDPIPEQDLLATTNHKKRNNVTFLLEPFSPAKFESGSRLKKVSPLKDDMLLTASPPSPTLSSNRRHCLYEESTFLLDQMPSDNTLMEKLDALLEEEEFNIQGDTMEQEFNFCTPAHHQATFNVSFPNQFGLVNNSADDSIITNAEFTDTPLYFSQDMMMAPTLQEFQEALF